LLAKSVDEARRRAYNFVYYCDQFSTEEEVEQDVLEIYTSVVNPIQLRLSESNNISAIARSIAEDLK